MIFQEASAGAKSCNAIPRSRDRHRLSPGRLCASQCSSDGVSEVVDPPPVLSKGHESPDGESEGGIALSRLRVDRSRGKLFFTRTANSGLPAVFQAVDRDGKNPQIVGVDVEGP